MISRSSVFRKSPKGVEAVASRQSGLARPLRSALIMIDGKRDVGEVVKLVATLGDPEALLAELEAAGLIELAGGTPVAQAAASAAPTATAPLPSGPTHAPSASLATAQHVASRLLLELLGPTAEALCLKIEAARDMPAFVAAVVRARDVLRDVKGQAAAVQFIEQVEAVTPSP